MEAARESALNYIAIVATRGSLEEDCRWYFRQLRTGDVYKAKRSTLEEIFFVQCVLSIHPSCIYTIENPTSKIKHRYFSAAETIQYVMKNCKMSFYDWDGPRETKGNQLLTVNQVAFVEEA